MKANNEKQADALLKASLLGLFPVNVERYTSLSSRRGTVSTDSLGRVSSEEIRSALTDQPISKASKLIGKKGGKPFPFRIVFFASMFKMFHSFIHVGYEKVSVCQCLPNPMCCFRRETLEDTQQSCASTSVCGVCADMWRGEVTYFVPGLMHPTPRDALCSWMRRPSRNFERSKEILLLTPHIVHRE